MPQGLVDAVTRQDVGLAVEDARSKIFYVHQFEDAELSFFVVEKQVDVGIVIGLVACRRAEQLQAFDAEALEVGLVLLQSLYGFVAFHGSA